MRGTCERVVESKAEFGMCENSTSILVLVPTLVYVCETMYGTHVMDQG